MQTDTSTSNNDFPPNVPAKLIHLYRELGGNQRALARHLAVNPGHINNLLKHGREPRDPEIRARLFLPKKMRQPMPAWFEQAYNTLAHLEKQAPPVPDRLYNRAGKRVR
jgi:hypothetical protein